MRTNINIACHLIPLRALRALRGGLVLLLLCGGCAIIPRGPRVSHTSERFSGRSDGLIAREVWRDDAFTRGIYIFTDPKMSFTAWHTNQAALGGCSHVNMASFSIVVDTNTAPILGAAGTAAGNIIGAAAKTAVK